jgi:hypothetical protein
MSRSYNLGHAFTTLTKENFREDVVFNFEFDEDMNGNNGIEYLPEEVVEGGYESTIPWAIDIAIELYGVSEKTIEHFLKLTIGSDSYYDKYDYGIIENDKDFIVSVAWLSGN